MKATGERWERCRWQVKRPERVAAVGERRSRTVGKESTGHRNRNCSSGGCSRYNNTKALKTAQTLGFFADHVQTIIEKTGGFMP